MVNSWVEEEMVHGKTKEELKAGVIALQARVDKAEAGMALLWDQATIYELEYKEYLLIPRSLVRNLPAASEAAARVIRDAEGVFDNLQSYSWASNKGRTALESLAQSVADLLKARGEQG